MNIEEIKAVIVSQREGMDELFRRERIIERGLDRSKVIKYLLHPNILVILGARRCGKSIFSWMLLSGVQFGYINFFDERLSGLHAKDLNMMLQAFYELYGNIDYFVFDELQKVTGWERFASRLRTSKKVVVTGSNSELLRGNLATFITGRHLDVELLPFGFDEYLKANGISTEKNWESSTAGIASVKKALSEFMEKGGFPEVGKFGIVMLQEIYGDIIENDIIKQHKIRNREALRNLSKYLISNAGNEITFSSLRNPTGIKDVHTVAKYVGYVSDAYLVFLVERFSFKLKEQFKAPKKVFCVDTGLARSVSFRFSEERGRIMENLVFLELLRRKLYESDGSELYYWKDHQGREIDIIVKQGPSVKKLIQVTYASESNEVSKREITALLTASRELKCDELIVVTWDYSGSATVEGKEIKFAPLWRWLLQEKTQGK